MCVCSFTQTMVLVLGLASNVVLCKIGIAKPSISSE